MLVPTKPAKLLERDVAASIKSYLKSHGWRIVRMQRTVVPGQFQTGESGMADLEAIYYLAGIKPGLSLTIWVETKAPSDRRRCSCLRRAKQGKAGLCSFCRQKEWRRIEESRGALFGPGEDLVEFDRWYWQHFAWLHDGRLPGQVELMFSEASR